MNTSKTFSCAVRLPHSATELQNDFWIEAKKYDVLPLDDRFSERGDPSLRPSLIAGRTDFTYYPGATRIPEPSAANTKNTSHTITATIEVPPGGADGVLVAEGGAAGGYTLYVKDGKPVYEYNYFAHERYKVTSSESLSPGPTTIHVDFKYDGGIGKGGTASLFINDNETYQPPFAYVGIIKTVTINIQPSALTASEQQVVRDAERAAAVTIE